MLVLCCFRSLALWTLSFVFWMWIKKSLTYLGLHFRGAYETFTATMVKEWERSPNMVHSHRVTGKGHIFR